ncbi:hypothetical protein NDU88_002657 [Pleurodeles waltl]|uniref:Uncharacterized protein n=1 Tax=Pleurodeles waltl TaxID=8319 RepID=A0AAV7T2I2_PLEWA|nr:hypothetical protein NDU88_002657 [Pleurodeles waltl]
MRLANRKGCPLPICDSHRNAKLLCDRERGRKAIRSYHQCHTGGNPFAKGKGSPWDSFPFVNVAKNVFSEQGLCDPIAIRRWCLRHRFASAFAIRKLRVAPTRNFRIANAEIATSGPTLLPRSPSMYQAVALNEAQSDQECLV